MDQAFVEGFDGKYVSFDSISFLVIEEIDVEAKCLLIDGDRWFRNRTLVGVDISFFLKDEYKDKPCWLGE